MWQFGITPEAEDDLDRLDASVRRRIVEKLEWFINHVDEATPLPLHHRWQGFFKLRVGEWRIVYRADSLSKKITIHLIDRRDKIYKR